MSAYLTGHLLNLTQYDPPSAIGQKNLPPLRMAGNPTIFLRSSRYIKAANGRLPTITSVQDEANKAVSIDITADIIACMTFFFFSGDIGT